MNDSNRCACSDKNSNNDMPSDRDTNAPKDIKTETMVTPDDFGKVREEVDGVVSEESVEESVVMINPDVDSMESRG